MLKVCVCLYITNSAKLELCSYNFMSEKILSVNNITLIINLKLLNFISDNLLYLLYGTITNIQFPTYKNYTIFNLYKICIMSIGLHPEMLLKSPPTESPHG